MESALTMEDAIRQVGLIAIPVLVPMVIGLFKTYFWSKVPSALLPVFAAVLGPVFDVALVKLAGADSTGWASVALGLAGVGLREVKEGALKVVKGVPRNGGGTAAAILLALFLGGCGAGTMLGPAPMQPAATIGKTPSQIVLGLKADYEAVLTLANAYRHDCEARSALLRQGCEKIVEEIQRLDRDHVFPAIEAARNSPDDVTIGAARAAIRQLETYILQHQASGKSALAQLREYGI